MEKYDPVRRSSGQARQLPHEYIPTEAWPRFAPEQIVALRRSNCRAFFPQLAQWYSELSSPSVRVCKKVGQAVTVALRHFGRHPEGALGRIE
eukprot:6372152-Alexandrium_andersonii.AAC.1